jgi:hypothetical protein
MLKLLLSEILNNTTTAEYTVWLWEDNIKMDLGEIGIDGANWIRLAQDRVR